MRGWSGLAAAVSCALVFVIAGAAAVRAGSCRVLVALGEMQVEQTVSGVVVRLSGTWEFDNLLQVGSGLSFNVLVVRGDNFTRLEYPDSSFEGYFPDLSEFLDEGLTGDKIPGIESAGAIEPAAKFAIMESQRMKLALPVPDGTGPISVVAYLVIDGDYKSAIISNVLSSNIKSTSTAPLVRVDAGAQR